MHTFHIAAHENGDDLVVFIRQIDLAWRRVRNWLVAASIQPDEAFAAIYESAAVMLLANENASCDRQYVILVEKRLLKAEI